VIKFDGISTKGIYRAATQAINAGLSLHYFMELKDDLIPLTSSLWSAPRSGDFCHCKPPYTKLCLSIFQVVRVLEVYEVESGLQRFGHLVTRTAVCYTANEVFFTSRRITFVLGNKLWHQGSMPAHTVEALATQAGQDKAD
jgi:hypothetical protein